MIERVDIDRLVIRLRHIEPHLARRAMEGLGREVLQELAAGDPQQSGGRLQVHHIDLGVLSSSGDAHVAGIRKQIGRAVAGAIQAKRMRGEGE